MNNLPMKREEGIFVRIINYFKKLLYSKKKLRVIESFKEDNVEIDSTLKRDNFINNIKSESSQDNIDVKIQLKKEKELFFEEIYDNPKILDFFSLDKLDKIDEHLDFCINQYKNMLKKDES